MTDPYLVVQTLTDALLAAQSHLEYCGYGDSWERECARESKLEQEIAYAIALGKAALDE